MSKFPNFIDPRLPRHQKEILITEILGLSRSELFLGEFKVTTSQKNKIIKLQKEILDGYPLQYALGSAHFLNLVLEVNDKVLIPRPETELLALEAVKYKVKNILEIGVGSGCVSIYLAKSSSAKITALDISPDALKIARKNAKKYKVEIKLIESDLFQNVGKKNKFDLIIANLPYGTSKQCTYSPEEPRLAIYGGKSGFEVIEKFMKNVRDHLTDQGTVLLEIDPSQSTLVSDCASKYRFDIKIKKDLNGRDRVVTLSAKI